MNLLQLLYNIINWQYFGIFAIIWIVVDLVWIGRWRALIGRLGKLITKPVIFEKDKEPDQRPVYPRKFLEQLALNSRREPKADAGAKTGAESKPANALSEWADALRIRGFDPKNPIRSLGYAISLILFVFFLIADAITVAATLDLMGVISFASLPPLFQRLELAILGGALLSTVVGIWMLIEMSGKGELINAEDLTPAQTKIYKLFAVVVTLFAGAVMVALAVQRLVSLGDLEASPTTSLILSFVLYGLLAINNSLAAALTFQPAASGFIVIAYLLVLLIIGLLPVFAFLADVVWRVAYVLIDIVAWALFTPLIAIPYGIGKVFGLIDDSNKPSGEDKNPAQPTKPEKK